MEEYDVHINGFIKRDKAYFLCCKECGYEFMIVISKLGTLKDLYRIVELELDNKKIELFVNYKDGFENKIENSITDIKDFLTKLRCIYNRNPVYPLPKPVVYKLWIKDK